MNPNFASSFAPYAPPPDEPAFTANPPASTSSAQFARPWFQQSQTVTSYQSGGIPTWNTSASGGIGSVEENAVQSSGWETRNGARVDMLAAFAYVLGPISAFALLIFETHNDYVRFHAYQSALLTTPLVLLRIFASLVHFPAVLRTFFTLLLVVSALLMAFQAYRDAAQNGLTRFHLPGVGVLAEQWLEEE